MHTSSNRQAPARQDARPAVPIAPVPRRRVRLAGLASLIVALAHSAPGAARLAMPTPAWVQWPLAAGASHAYPLERWVPLGESATPGASGAQAARLRGGRWAVSGREEGDAARLPGAQASRLVAGLPHAQAAVFAVYAPQDATLRVRVVRVERTPDARVRAAIADFTPDHGERWAAARHYLAPHEAADPARPGRNPFAAFRGSAAADPVFRDIGWTAAQVAVGHAMRLHHAAVGYVAWMDTRWSRTQSASGGWLRRRVTVTTEARVRPAWHLAFARDLHPWGLQAAYCVAPQAGTCPSTALVATSGLSLVPWEGGNLPEAEEPVHAWSDSRSGWTVLSFALFTGGLFWAASALAAGASVFPASLPAHTAAGLTPLAAGSYAAGAYAAGATLFGGGGALTDAQGRWLGGTGDGVLQPPAPADAHEAAVRSRVQALAIEADPAQSLAALREVLPGGCGYAPTTSTCAVAGAGAGLQPRPDPPMLHDTPSAIRRRSGR